MEVGEMLQDEMQRMGVSKNEIIRKTGIDRSTFYQIIRGKRQATQEQLMQMLDSMEAEQAFRVRVLEEYEKEKVDEKAYRNRLAVRNFMNRVAMPDEEVQGKSAPCPAPIRDVIHHAVRTPSARIQIFLPGSLMIRTGIYAEMIRSAKSQSLSMDYLSVFTDEEEGSETMFLNIEECLRCFFRKNLSLQIYHLRGVSMPSEGIPYPYYIITEDQMLLISADAGSFFAVADENQIRVYRQYFEKLVQKAEPLITSNRDSKDLFRNIGAEYRQALEKRQRISFITPCPCIMRTITKEELQKYLPDPQILAYWDLMNSLDLQEFTNRSGTVSLLENGLIRESGFHIQITKQDMPILHHNIRSRLGRDLFLLNNDNIQMSDYWEFMVVGTEKVIFLPFYEAGFTITMNDAEIASMVADWCESRIETINADLMQDVASGHQN